MKKLSLKYSLLLLSIVNFIAMIVGLSLLGNSVPVHMNINMVIAMGSPWWAIVLAIIPVLCGLGLFIEMKIRGENYKNKKYISIILYSLTLLFIYINWLCYAMFASGLQIGDKMNVSLELLIGLPIGFLFIIMGNYMPVIKQNKTLGIKTKSTLSSEKVWTKTHRLCGILAVSSGLLIILFAVLAFLTKISWLFFSAVIISVILPAIVPMVFAKIYSSKLKKENLIEEKQKENRK